MGIPSLATTLGPYASSGRLKDDRVVIDGPAFAYHILHICRLNGVPQPSYSLLHRSALAWLQELSSQKVTVEAIYFDGHLPSFKRDVRMERLTRSLARIRNSYSRRPHGCPDYAIAPRDQLLDVDVFRVGIIETHNLIDPSFLVPAVLDALRQSPQYQAITWVVPDEADLYCAKHASETGCLVLTSDSDLLVYDLQDGRVSFFRSIHRGDNSNILLSSFAPRSIWKSIGLPPSVDSVRLAYERKRSPRATLHQIVQLCLKTRPTGSDFQQFRQRYQLPSSLSLPSFAPSGCLSALSGLDSRVSELVIRLSPHYGCHDTQSDAAIFLPVLAENPARESAWVVSRSIRRLAYTLLRFAICEVDVAVIEYRRVHSPLQTGTRMDTMSPVPAQQYSDELCHLVHRAEKSCRQDALYWPLICLALVLNECKEQGKAISFLRTLQKLQGSQNIDAQTISWDLIHLVAQLQAACYSLRILQQALSLIPGNFLDVNTLNVNEIREALPDIVPIPSFPDIDSTKLLLLYLRKPAAKRVWDELNLEVAASTKSNSNALAVTIGGMERINKPQNQKPRSNHSNATGNRFSALPFD